MKLLMSGRTVFPGGAGLILAFLAACASAPIAPTTRPPVPASAGLSTTPAPAATQIPTPKPTASAAKPATQLALRQVGAPGTLFGLAELEIDTDGIATNPFDPAQTFAQDLAVKIVPVKKS
jgi:hypothetical protein